MTTGLAVGEQVEVRIAFTGTWSAGFEVTAQIEGGYQLRRCSDGRLLPSPTGPADVRALS